jgi:hypothetical protein
MKAGMLVAMVALALVAVISPAAASSATGTFLQLDSQSGDPLGGGLQQTFTPSDATFRAWSNGEDTFVNVYAPTSGVWDIEISAPRGSGQLVPGTYTNIARSPFRAWGQPGMNVTSPAGGCNTVSGTFTVNEAVYGPYIPGFGYLRVISFDATFEVHCSDVVPALTGHVRYEDPPDTTPPTISPVDDITTEAEDATGTNVYYNMPFASDAVDPSPQLACDPPYAARFPIGETTVTCTARDYSGNVSQSTFKVTVIPPLDYTFTIDSLGTVDPNSGVATVSGTIKCSRPAYMFVSYGDVVQVVAKRATLTGNFPGYVQVDCSRTATRWTQTALPPNGKFAAGKAHVDVLFAGACDLRCFYFSQSKDITLRAKSA